MGGPQVIGSMPSRGIRLFFCAVCFLASDTGSLLCHTLLPGCASLARGPEQSSPE
jgi:hypothetical protein